MRNLGKRVGEVKQGKERGLGVGLILEKLWNVSYILEWFLFELRKLDIYIGLLISY